MWGVSCRGSGFVQELQKQHHHGAFLECLPALCWPQKITIPPCWNARKGRQVINRMVPPTALLSLSWWQQSCQRLHVFSAASQKAAPWCVWKVSEKEREKSSFLSIKMNNLGKKPIALSPLQRCSLDCGLQTWICGRDAVSLIALNCPKVVFWERVVTHSFLHRRKMDWCL